MFGEEDNQEEIKAERNVIMYNEFEYISVGLGQKVHFSKMGDYKWTVERQEELRLQSFIKEEVEDV